MNKSSIRIVAIVMGLFIILLVYLFQRVSFATGLAVWMPSILTPQSPSVIFIIDKTLRLLINDTACLLIIYGWFQKKVYVQAAFYLFLIEFFFLLPMYLAIKLSWEGPSEISSPLLSHIHRLIVNPLMMILLMGGFACQRMSAQKQ
jgi:exosortase F-associated protein